MINKFTIIENYNLLNYEILKSKKEKFQNFIFNLELNQKYYLYNEKINDFSKQLETYISKIQNFKNILNYTKFFHQNFIYDLIVNKFINHIFKPIFKSFKSLDSNNIEETKILKKLLFVLIIDFFEKENISFLEFIFKEEHNKLMNIFCTEYCKLRIKISKQNIINIPLFNCMDNIPKILILVCSIQNNDYENFNNDLKELNEVIKFTDENLNMNKIDLFQLRTEGLFIKIENKLIDNYNEHTQKEIIKILFGYYSIFDLDLKIEFEKFKIILAYFKKHNIKIIDKFLNLIKSSITNESTQLDIEELVKKSNPIINNYIEFLNLSKIDAKIDDRLNDLNKNKDSIRKENKKFFTKILKEKIQIFLEKYYHNSHNSNNIEKLIKYHCEDAKIFFWNNILLIVEQNWLKISSNNLILDKVIYGLIYSYEMTLDESDNINNIIFDNYDSIKINENYKINFKKYNELLKGYKLNPIVFVDNNLLSVKNRKIFSKYEKKGDLLYEIIIKWLILEAKIEFSDVYLSSKFQDTLIESLNFANIIQTNDLSFGKNFEYKQADYFEALLFDIYSQTSINVLKEFILKLFTNNCSWALIKEKCIDKKSEYTKNKMFFLKIQYPKLLDICDYNLEKKIPDLISDIFEKYTAFLLINEFNADMAYLDCLSGLYFCKESSQYSLYYLLNNDVQKFNEFIIDILKKEYGYKKNK